MKPSRVLVTGASRGIGRAIATRLLGEGREVVLVARDRGALEEVARAAPDHAHVLEADLTTDIDVVERAVAMLSGLDGRGGLDGLVHAAGVATHAPLEAISDAQLESAWGIHLRAPLRLTQALAKHLRAQKRSGSIVLISSTLALRPAAGTLAYSAAKAAMVALTKGAALELAPDGIRVNTLAPGVVDTEMVRALRLAPGEAMPTGHAHEARVAAQLEALRKLHPIGRLGTPDEVAEAAVFLLDAAWATGSVLTLDGGLTAG